MVSAWVTMSRFRPLAMRSCEWVKGYVSPLAAGGPAHPLGDGPDLAQPRRVEGQQPVGLAEIGAFEHDRLGAIKPLPVHYSMLLRRIRYPLGLMMTKAPLISSRLVCLRKSNRIW